MLPFVVITVKCQRQSPAQRADHRSHRTKFPREPERYFHQRFGSSHAGRAFRHPFKKFRQPNRTDFIKNRRGSGKTQTRTGFNFGRYEQRSVCNHRGAARHSGFSYGSRKPLLRRPRTGRGKSADYRPFEHISSAIHRTKQG